MREKNHVSDRMFVRQKHHERSIPMPIPAAGGIP
jgi:hypothetical protein